VKNKSRIEQMVWNLAEVVVKTILIIGNGAEETDHKSPSSSHLSLGSSPIFMLP
jgi:hypothetical protein